MNRNFIEENLLRNLSFIYPGVSKKVDSCHSISPYELIVTTTDGEKYLYDDELRTIRQLHNSRSEIGEDNLPIEFGANLRRMMRRKRVSQSELSESTGISQPAVSAYINGRRSPTLSTIHKISIALDCDIDELICIK